MGYAMPWFRSLLGVLAAFWLAAAPPAPAWAASNSSVSPKSATTLITDYYNSILQRPPDAPQSRWG